MYILLDMTNNEDKITVIEKINICNNKKNDDYVVIDNDQSNHSKCISLQNIDQQLEFITIFNYRDYIDNILKTYDYKWDRIYSQFEKDFYRCKFSINNVQFNDIKMFVKDKNLHDITMGTIAIMLFNQSTLGWPFEKIIKYHNIKDNLLLTDFNGSSIYININVESDNQKYIHIYKRLVIVELVYKNDIFIDKKNKYYVDINLNFNFENINKFIRLKNIKDYIDEFNTMSWKILPI